VVDEGSEWGDEVGGLVVEVLDLGISSRSPGEGTRLGGTKFDCTFVDDGVLVGWHSCSRRQGGAAKRWGKR